MPHTRLRIAACLALAGIALQPLDSAAADAASAAKPGAAARPAAKPQPARPRPATAKAAVEEPPGAPEPPQEMTTGKLEVADRVLTGEAACEFNQTVQVDRIDGRPGHFKLSYKKAVYTMVPEETTTGAVRLEDKRAGVVWLQIPSKSMLMNHKIGQRMVDACTHSEQRAALAAAEAAARAMPVAAPAASDAGGLGIAGVVDAKK